MLDTAGGGGETRSMQLRQIFPSYCHRDDEPYGPQNRRWVEEFEKALRESIGQRIGPGRVDLWRDKRRLAGNELFDARIAEQPDRSAIFVTVLSQHYRSSAYCKKEFQSFAATTKPDPALRFAARRTEMGGQTPDGRRVYRYDLFPSPASLKGALAAASQISYYMNHPTFNVKLLSAGAGTRFTASYNGGGCLIEFSDPNTPPQLTEYDQCAALPSSVRQSPF